MVKATDIFLAFRLLFSPIIIFMGDRLGCKRMVGPESPGKLSGLTAGPALVLVSYIWNKCILVHNIWTIKYKYNNPFLHKVILCSSLLRWRSKKVSVLSVTGKGKPSLINFFCECALIFQLWSFCKIDLRAPLCLLPQLSTSGFNRKAKAAFLDYWPCFMFLLSTVDLKWKKNSLIDSRVHRTA